MRKIILSVALLLICSHAWGQVVSNKKVFKESGTNTYLNTSTNNVGIGSSTPASKLDVSGTVQATGIKITTNPSSGYVLTSNSVGVGTWMPSAGGGGSSQWTTSGSDIYYSTGNVGIGTSAVGQKLDVFGNLRVISSDTLAGIVIGTNAAKSQGIIFPNGGYIQDPGSYTSASFGIDGAGYRIALGQSGSIKAVVSSAGNVGIGTINPAQLLEVNGNIYSKTGSIGFNGGSGLLRSNPSLSNTAQLYFSNGASLAYYNGSAVTDGLVLQANGSVANVGIGSTNPTALLETNVNTGSVATGLRLTNSATSATQGRGVKISATGTGGTDFADIYMDTYTASNNNGRIILRPYSAGSAVNAVAIIPSGNVGIGSLGPGKLLDVAGQARFTTAGFKSEYDNGNTSTAQTITWSNGNKQKSTLTGNCTFTFTAPTNTVTSLRLKLVQDGTGSRTATWPAAVKWASGTAPTLTTTASATDMVWCDFDGTNYYCSTGLDMK